MKRINRLIQRQDYQKHLQKTYDLEQTRVYCKHGFDHLLAVARIAYIYLLEQGEYSLQKELVYTAALLHDLGRWVEYQTGEDHAEASARLALPLMEEEGFSHEEIDLIQKAILEHRKHGDAHLSTLGTALAKADDWARDCLNCTARQTCHKFSPEMMEISY